MNIVFAVEINLTIAIMKSRKNITRFTYENSDFQGWRVAYTRAGEKFVRYFSDKQYGGVRKSLTAAQDHLEELKKVLEKIPPQTSLARPGKKGGSIVGVHRAESPGGKGSSSKATWVASWNEGGKRKTRKFSVAKYGERQAKQMAIKAREEANSENGRDLDRSEIRNRLREARRMVQGKLS